MRLIRNEEGGIYGEAVVVLPAFILVWTLVSFVFTGYEQASQMGMDVRREMWQHSQNSNTWSGPNEYHDGVCEGGTGSVGTSSSPLLVSVVGMVTLIPRMLSFGAQWVPGVLWPGSGASFSIGPINLSLPGGNWLQYTSFAKNKWHYTLSGSVARPIIGGSADVGHHTYLVCDENETEMTDIEASIWLGITWFIIKGKAGV